MVDMVMTIVEGMNDENGEYIPCVVVKGQSGYYPTELRWGKDREGARKQAIEYNKKMGFNKREASDMVLNAMFMKVN